MAKATVAGCQDDEKKAIPSDFPLALCQGKLSWHGATLARSLKKDVMLLISKSTMKNLIFHSFSH